MTSATEKLEGWEITSARVKVPGMKGLQNLVGVFPTDEDPWPRLSREGLVRLIGYGETGAASAVDAIVGIGDGWALRLRLSPPGEVVGVELAAVTDEAARFGTNMVRRMGLGRALDDTLARISDYVIATRYLGEGWPGPPPRPGRRGTDERIYAQWALWYVQALEESPRAPRKVMVRDHPDDMGGPRSEAQVRGMVNRARTRGYLTPAPPGRAGGELTDKARDLLRTMEGTL